jgi:hypothetical protein
MIVRVTEQVSTVVEVTYDVDVPPEDVDSRDVEDYDVEDYREDWRETHRRPIRQDHEIFNIEEAT